MIFGIVGEGGTGKSAITVAMSLDHLCKYDIIYTNIKGYNKNNSVFDISQNLNCDIDIRHFDNTPDDFIRVLYDILSLQEDNENDEKFRILVMYDECHKSLRRYLSSKDDDIFISDFLSEHRHYHTDFYFMTQGYKKIADMYKGDFKAWYVSVDDQLKNNPDEILFRKFDKECKIKVGFKKFKKSTIWRGKTGTNYKVFDCYDSGDDGKKMQKQSITLIAKKKYIVYILAVIVLFTLYRAFNTLYYTFYTKDTNKSSLNLSKIKYADSNSSTIQNVNVSRLQLLKDNKDLNSIVSDYSFISCIYYSKKHLYIFNNKILTEKNFNSLNNLFLFQLTDIQIISENVYRYEYLVGNDLLNILTGVTNKQKKLF